MTVPPVMITVDGYHYRRVGPADPPRQCQPTDEIPERCPFCGGNQIVVHHAEDETFYPRPGCRDCDRWFGLPRLRNP